jgi:hypothetical protein
VNDAPRASSPRERGRDTHLTRRALLGSCSALATALSGCEAFDSGEPATTEPTTSPSGGVEPATATPTQSPREAWAAEFETVVDAVGDLGCDPDGEASCDEAVEAISDEEVLVTFPGGTYQFDRGHTFQDVTRIGFLGTGDDVAFRPPDGFNGKLWSFLGEWVLFSGIDVDVTATDTTAGLRFITTSGFHIEDVEFNGRGLHPDGSVVNALALGVQDESERGLVRNVRALRGSAIGHYKEGNGRVGMWIGHRHVGHIDVENCHLEEFGNNGIYGSRCEGTVGVTGGVYRNNNVAGVRLGGGGNQVRDATIEVDLDRYSGPYTRTNADYDTRTVVVEQGPKDLSGRVRVTDCTLRVTKADRSQGVLVVWPSGNGPRIEGCTIETEVDWVSEIQANAPGPKVGKNARGMRVSDTTVSGTGNWGSAVAIVGRPGSTIDRTAIAEQGLGRDGLRLVESNPCALSATSIRTTGYPIYAVNPRRAADGCLVTLADGTEIVRTGPDITAVRSSEMTAEPTDTEPGTSRQCVGSEVISAVDSYEGVGITAMDGDTVFWRPYGYLESIPER